MKNCVLLNNASAIYMWNVDDAVASGNTILYSLSRAILISNNQTRRISVLNNYIWNTGQLIGMGIYNHEYSLRGIVARTGNDPNNIYLKIQ